MRTVEYKGYLAGFEYDDKAELYCGSVINTEPYAIVIFELPEGYDVYQEFQVSIDMYLESCVEDGIEPLPPLPYPDAHTGGQETRAVAETEVIRQ